MTTQPNIGGALCESSVIPFFVPCHKVWLTATARVLCSNAGNIGERKTWMQSEFCSWQNSVRGQEPPKCIYTYSVPAQDMAKHPAVLLTSIERRRCSNKAKTRKPLKLAGVPQTRQQFSAVSGWKFTILWGHMEEILLFNMFFPVVDTSLSCEDIAGQSCAMLPRW